MAPARIETTSRSSWPVRRGWPSTIRPARSRAVPDGRSSLVRRCHSTRYGSNPSTGPNSATAASTSRPNSATPRLKFEAATAAAPCPRAGRSTSGRSAVQPVVAMTKPPDPGLERAGHVGRDRVAAGRLDHQVRAGERRRGGGARRRRPAEDADRSARARGRAAATARPRPPSPRIVMVCMSSVPRFAWWRAAGSGGQTRKSRGHRRGAAAPGASVPWRPRFVVSDAPSRAPGPVPPGRAARASSSTPRRRCGGSCENHTHIPGLMQPFPAGPLAGPRSRGGTHRRCPHPPLPAPGPLANLPRPLDERERGRGRGRRVAASSGSPRSSG